MMLQAFGQTSLQLRLKCPWKSTVLETEFVRVARSLLCSLEDKQCKAQTTRNDCDVN